MRGGKSIGDDDDDDDGNDDDDDDDNIIPLPHAAPLPHRSSKRSVGDLVFGDAAAAAKPLSLLLPLPPHPRRPLDDLFALLHLHSRHRVVVVAEESSCAGGGR